MSDTLDAKQRRRLRQLLLTWYDRCARAMPWRTMEPHQPDPYHVLVSEAMLQQTQVATVIDYFNRFITRFPTLKHLAQAQEQQVLQAWQGLGYYRRARHLHAAARQIVDQYGGQVPVDVETLLKLPGVGRYTAGAIASIAHGVRAPILDGNVARVLSRWLLIEQPIDQPNIRSLLWEYAAQLVPPSRPGAFNQAMMDLGATLCTPRNPACLTCPMQRACRACQSGMTEQLPKRLAKKKPLAVTHQIIAIHRRSRWLFEQRPDKGLWSNMWQMPTLQSASSLPLGQWIQTRLGLVISQPTLLTHFSHQTTHRTIRFELWTAPVESGRLKPQRGRWRSLTRLDDLPLAVPQQRAIKFLLDSSN